jgi:hypothetical protein
MDSGIPYGDAGGGLGKKLEIINRGAANATIAHVVVVSLRYCTSTSWC